MGVPETHHAKRGNETPYSVGYRAGYSFARTEVVARLEHYYEITRISSDPETAAKKTEWVDGFLAALLLLKGEN